MQYSVLSAIVARALLASKLGMQYNDERDIYRALGYPKDLTEEDFYARYRRQDIAKAVINRPVAATWKGGFRIEEGEKEETAFDKAWKELDSKFKIANVLRRADRLACIGNYGVLLLGLDDVNNKNDFAKPVESVSSRQLLYLRPYRQGTVAIERNVKDTSDERYGLPELYKIKMVGASGEEQEILVHYTRIIHIVPELLESEYKGIPPLEAVYNRLMDLEKLVGSSAEMFWRGARPGYQGKVDKEYQVSDDMIEKFKQQIDEYENNLRRILITEGIDLKELAMQITDPSSHVDVQLQMISAVTGIPKRILVGSERGELASTQDRDNWADFIQSRRQEFAEYVIRDLVDRLIEYEVLPEPKQYNILWEPINVPSEKDKAEVGRIRAQALKDYVTSGSEIIMPVDAFLEHLLGLPPEQVEALSKELESMAREEENASNRNNSGQVEE